eukprot:7390261-Prymnesium_polylepis.5
MASDAPSKPTEVSLLLGNAADGQELPAVWPCGITNRDVWQGITLVILFMGNFALPFVINAPHATKTAMTDDAVMGLSAGALSSLDSAEHFTSCFTLLFAHTLLHWLQPRGTYILVLAGVSISALFIGSIRTAAVYSVFWCVVGLFYALNAPTVGSTVAHWVDGHLLGRTLGIISAASKISPSERRGCRIM